MAMTVRLQGSDELLRQWESHVDLPWRRPVNAGSTTHILQQRDCSTWTNLVVGKAGAGKVQRAAQFRQSQHRARRLGLHGNREWQKDAWVMCTTFPAHSLLIECDRSDTSIVDLDIAHCLFSAPLSRFFLV